MLAALAQKAQLSSTSVVKEVHFGRSGSKVATFQYKEVHFGGPGSKIATFQYKCSKASRFGRSGSKVQHKRSKGSTLRQLQLKSLNLSAQRVG